jgi:uncharacterized protein (TIGR02271 family)
MAAAENARLIDRDGFCARLAPLDAEGAPLVAVLDSGATVLVPPALITQHDGDTYHLAARFADLLGDVGEEEGKRPPETGAAPPMADNGALTIPVVAEEVQVRTERTTTGRVRVRKIVHREEQTIDEPILQERVDVERVAIDRWVDEAPPIRSEGRTLVVPVVEEVLVVEKRLRLREEVRLTWRCEEEREPQHLVVRREEVRVERLPGGADGESHVAAGGRDEPEPAP